MSLKTAKKICKILQNANYKAYLVGGCVRDILLNLKPHDTDITTNALPQQIKELFISKGLKVFSLGEKFGTITVLKDNEQIEITTFRSETDYKDFRHPLSVKFETDIKEDLKRRDFTINAMALNPCTNELIDLFNGKEDLIDNIIRCVGNPTERFKEDALRMLRAIRFSAKLNSVIETNTFNAIKDNVELIKNVAYERIKEELLKILSVKDCYFALEYMLKSGLLNTILPELAKLKDVKQPRQYHKHNVLYHNFLTVLEIPETKPLLRFCALIHDIGKTEMRLSSPYFPNHEISGNEIFLSSIAPRFKLSNQETEYISFLISNHMSQFNFKNIINNKSALKRYLSKMGNNIKYLDDLFLLYNADKLATCVYEEKQHILIKEAYQKLSEIINNKEALQIRDLDISGYDLISLGVPQDKTMQYILNELLNAVINGLVDNKREDLIKEANRILYICNSKA